ncbi:MAG TPA: class I SAM-dependent methyltransferase [Caldimonas sp.]|nr:class I SAM-dependent methyltransferase [Caldimonas sp.]
MSPPPLDRPDALLPVLTRSRSRPRPARAWGRPRLPRAISAWLGLPWRARWQWAGRKVGELLRGGDRIDTPDRVILEREVLPALAADPSLRSLLFVGCGRYTRHYAAMFRPATERLRTLDIDPRRARYGHTGHLVAALQDVDRHLPAASVDAVVCNGVYGFGIYDREELAKALRASCAVLRPGGTFVLGWNDVPAFAPFDPLEVALAAGLVRDAALLGSWRVVTDTPTRHTFDTYIRAR